jgi:hypothetical protein
MTDVPRLARRVLALGLCGGERIVGDEAEDLVAGTVGRVRALDVAMPPGFDCGPNL